MPGLRCNHKLRISKCFRKAGILTASMIDVVARDNVDTDPFAELDDSIELQHLIDETMGPDQSCPATEYVRGDEDLSVCVDLNGNDWEANFLSQLGQSSTTEDNDHDEDDDHDEPVSTLLSFSEAGPYPGGVFRGYM